jgi:hypothetical protein
MYLRPRESGPAPDNVLCAVAQRGTNAARSSQPKNHAPVVVQRLQRVQHAQPHLRSDTGRQPQPVAPHVRTGFTSASTSAPHALSPMRSASALAPCAALRAWRRLAAGPSVICAALCADARPLAVKARASAARRACMTMYWRSWWSRQQNTPLPSSLHTYEMPCRSCSACATTGEQEVRVAKHARR